MIRHADGHRKTRALTRWIARARNWDAATAKTFAVGLLERLWHETAERAPNGAIGRCYTNEEIAEAVGWPDDPSSAGALVGGLVGCGWLDDVGGDVRLYVHDWHDWAQDWVHIRLARAVLPFALGHVPKVARVGTAERSVIVEKWRSRYGVSPVEFAGTRMELADESVRTDLGVCAHEQSTGQNSGSIEGPRIPEPGEVEMLENAPVRTKRKVRAHKAESPCAQTSVRTPCALPVPRPRPVRVPEEEEGRAHAVRTPCARPSSYSSSSTSFVGDCIVDALPRGVTWDREENKMRICIDNCDLSPPQAVYQCLFARLAPKLSWVAAAQVGRWALVCQFWLIHGYNCSAFEKLRDRFLAAINGQAAAIEHFIRENGARPIDIVVERADGLPLGCEPLDYGEEGLWAAALKSLAGGIDRESMDLWLRPIVPARSSDGTLVLVCESERSRNWIASSYGAAILGAVRPGFGVETQITFETDSRGVVAAGESE